MTDIEEKLDNEDIEIKLLLEAIFLKYGYDFREYADSHTKRRLVHRKNLSGIESISGLQQRLLYDEDFFQQLLLDLSINVTEMFRDPTFYKAVREMVVPYLKTYPFAKVWHAGCSAGQEVYSMAILLQEEQLKERCQLYATDFNEVILAKAKAGIYSSSDIRKYTSNYIRAGGKSDFANYYRADNSNAIIASNLRNKMLFSQHNLVTDGVFGEMNVIFCRNVLIYFNRDLQSKVINLFYESLCPGGFLCLGNRETLNSQEIKDRFTVISEENKIYRKKR